MTESIIAKRLSGIPPSLILKLRHNATSPESVRDRKEGCLFRSTPGRGVLSESLATPTIGLLVRRPATCVGRSVFDLEGKRPRHVPCLAEIHRLGR